MLKRLIKYDMRAISKIALPMYLASGIINILCCVVLYFSFGFAEEIESVFSAIMLTGGLYFVGILTIAVMLIVVVLAVEMRYYRAVFSDEGYLNMVIPVTRRQFLNSKIISGVVWVLLSGLVAGACVFVSVLLPTLLYDTSLISEAVEMIKADIGVTDFSVPFLLATNLTGVLLSLLALVKDVMLVITAITVSSVYFKRFRVLVFVAVYFGIVLVEEAFVTAVKSVAVSVAADYVWAAFVLSTVLELFVIASTFFVGYFVSHHALEKKFNLE